MSEGCEGGKGKEEEEEALGSRGRGCDKGALMGEGVAGVGSVESENGEGVDCMTGSGGGGGWKCGCDATGGGGTLKKAGGDAAAATAPAGGDDADPSTW